MATMAVLEKLLALKDHPLLVAKMGEHPQAVGGYCPDLSIIISRRMDMDRKYISRLEVELMGNSIAVPGWEVIGWSKAGHSTNIYIGCCLGVASKHRRCIVHMNVEVHVPYDDAICSSVNSNHTDDSCRHNHMQSHMHVIR